MENFDKLFNSCVKKMQINENKHIITDIKTPIGKKIYTILNDAKLQIKESIEKLFKKSDENRGVISNTVLQQMPDFIDLVAKLERMSTFKDSFDNDVEPEVEEPSFETNPEDDIEDDMDMDNPEDMDDEIE